LPWPQLERQKQDLSCWRIPAIVIRLLFGAEITGAGVVMSRIAGIALFALGAACWPGRDAGDRALWGMLSYSLLATLYLGYLGTVGEFVGILYWPATALHAVLTIHLARAWFKAR